MRSWRHMFGDRPIVTRLVLAVAAAMTAVLLASGAFVFWRVEYALDRQLDQDLDAYRQVVERAIIEGQRPPPDTPGLSYQVYSREGGVLYGDAEGRLLDAAAVRDALSGSGLDRDQGRLIPPAAHPYSLVANQVTSPAGTVVVASSISRLKHDEALRELLLQLGIADLATLAAASIVGYATARGALNPVERYRVAAERADGTTVLPVVPDRDDEVSRLGHTFNALLERIGQANERERQFLADASHELRSPLALMRTELEMAARQRPTEPGTEATFHSLRTQVERLISVSNALLDLEELRASRGLPAREQVDVEELVVGVLARFESVAESRSFETTVDHALTVKGNRHWLDVALGNLVANALRHGEGTVVISAITSFGWVQLAVHDEGPGFPPDFVERAFDRFSRAESSRTTRGSGLGLALVQAIAEAHGGAAYVSGAGVVLDLPKSSHAPLP